MLPVIDATKEMAAVQAVAEEFADAVLSQAETPPNGKLLECIEEIVAGQKRFALAVLQQADTEGMRSWAKTVLDASLNPNELHNLEWYRAAATKLALKCGVLLDMETDLKNA